MEIKVTKLTDKSLLDKACSFTVNKEVHPSLGKMYRAEHSPIRTQIFSVEMYDIPTFVSVHLVRHSVSILHFVKSNREDGPCPSEDRGRMTPVNHLMIINAQSLINMARKRLCKKSHETTRQVMKIIKEKINEIDHDLAINMVADCLYRGRCCELKSCENKNA